MKFFILTLITLAISCQATKIKSEHRLPSYELTIKEQLSDSSSGYTYKLVDWELDVVGSRSNNVNRKKSRILFSKKVKALAAKKEVASAIGELILLDTVFHGYVIGDNFGHMITIKMPDKAPKVIHITNERVEEAQALFSLLNTFIKREKLKIYIW
jgi:hypothetical protein